MIRVHGLAKRFASKTAVSDATFACADGLVTGLLGPNGAGKTTTLRMLYGLYTSDRGRVEIDHQDLDRRSLGRLGVLPDVTGLYPRMTPREHLIYAGRLQGLGPIELAQAVAPTLAAFGLESLADRRCAGFSHGERRRVAFAMAMVHDPQNIVLDEPTNGLDVLAIRSLRQTLRQLAERGKCVLFSSHVMQEVSAVCDRVVVMAEGRIAADGAPAELIEATGAEDLEDAFVSLIGSAEGLN